MCRCIVLLLMFLSMAAANPQVKSDKTKPKPKPDAKKPTKPDAKKDAAPGDAKVDSAKLQGSWQFVMLVSDGIEVAEAGITKMDITFKGDKLIRKDGEDEEEFTFVLDAARKPRLLDLTPTSEERKDKKQQGIYELDGDKLKLCIADPGKVRPKEFASTAGMPHEYIVLERKK